MLGNLNVKVGYDEIEGIVGQYGVLGRNESVERLLEICSEQELVHGW